MANQALRGKKWRCPIDGKDYTYSYAKKVLSIMDNADSSSDAYQKHGGKAVHDWLREKLDSNRDSVKRSKKVKGTTSVNNEFKKSHSKDNTSAEPTRVRMPKLHKSTGSNYLSNNEVVYEEVQRIKKLINEIEKR